jgi:hypothetical protein
MKLLNQFKLNIKKSLLLICAAIILVALIAYSPNIIFIILSVWLVYKIFYPTLNAKIFDSRIFSGVIILFIYTIILQCVILSSWLLNVNFPLDKTPLLSLVILLIFYTYRYLLARNKNPEKLIPIKRTPIIQTSDIISIIIATIITIIVVLPPLIRYGIDKPSSIITLTSGNMDDAAHLGLVNDRLQFNRGILYGSDATKDMRQDNNSYPAGWHSANAVFIKSYHPNISTGTESLTMYSLSKVFWFFILIYCFSKVIFVLYNTLRNKDNKKSLPAISWLIGGVSLFSFIFLIDSFEFGFYSFTPQLIAALLLIPILLQFSLQNNQQRQHQGTLLILSLICIGGCLPWFLVTPAFILTIVMVITDCLKNIGLKQYLKNIALGILDNLPIYALLLIAMAAQLYVMLVDKSSGSASFFQSILLNGGVPIYQNWFYIFIFIGLALCVSFAYRKSDKSLRYVLYAILPIFLFAGAIYIIQMILIGTNAYYYYKVLYVFSAVALPVGLVGIALYIDHISQTRSASTALSVVIISILITVQFVGFSPQLMAYVKGHRSVSTINNESIYNELKTNASQKSYNNKHYTFYYVPSKALQNDVSMMTVKSNQPNSVCFNATRTSFGMSPNFNNPLNVIKKSCSGYTVNIITDNEQIGSLNKLIQDMDLQNTVKAQSYDYTKEK